MIIKTELTYPERRLVQYLEQKLGEHACAFLMAGYGEGTARRRSLVVSSVDEHGAAVNRHFEMVAIQSVLPHGRDPFVLGALLKLFLEVGEERLIIFHPKDLLRQFSAENSPRPVGPVKEALLRYYETSYEELLKPPQGQAGEELPACRRVRRLMISVDVEDLENLNESEVDETYVEISFHPDVARQLRRGGLFGIDWSCVTSVESHILFSSSESDN